MYCLQALNTPIVGMTCLLSGWGRTGGDEHYNGDMFGQPYR